LGFTPSSNRNKTVLPESLTKVPERPEVGALTADRPCNMRRCPASVIVRQTAGVPIRGTLVNRINAPGTAGMARVA
jgi:hypothetical protein